MQKNTPTDWENLLSAAAHLQKILPDAVLPPRSMQNTGYHWTQIMS
jgi:hypothetical protein